VLKKILISTVLLTASAAFAVTAAEDGKGKAGELDRLRNLGKAFYENPTTQYEAVERFREALELAPESARERVNYGLSLLRAGEEEKGIAELRKAQEQDPSIPHTWFNLGIAHKRAGEYGQALEQLEGMLQRVPDEPITHYNLGVLYKLEGEPERAVEHFERAAELDPNLAGPHFQLSVAYRQAGRADDAKREMARFRELKARDAEAAVPEDLEWSFYAEIYDPPAPGRAAPPAADPELAPRTLARGVDPGTAALAVLDADGDGTPDLLAASAAGVKLFAGGTEEKAAGLGELRGVTGVAAGDLDDDGLADLCFLTGAGAALYRNAGGRFEPLPAPVPEGPFRSAVWLDYDHDYDLDLFLLGARSALLRNQGEAGFADRTGDFPFVDGTAVDGTVLDLVADTQGMDLAVVYEGRKGVLYRDRLAGRYEPTLLPGVPVAMTEVTAFDADGDGWTDLAVADGERALVLRNDRREGFHPPEPVAGGAPLLWADLENRGAADFLAGGAFFRNLGGEPSPAPAPAGWPGSPAAAAAADFDGDGKVDLAAVDAEGVLHLLTNRTETDHRWLRVALEGVKNPKLAPGAEVEVKAGARYQKRRYDGTPLLFGLGTADEVDTVRITWPNGLIQNQPEEEPGRTASYREAQRLSGSCPMIFTWNGEGFEFITDVLGVAPLGASSGDGGTFPVDSDEHVRIPGSSLAAVDGRYEIRITEELREVAYLDRIRLFAVDHPESVTVVTNDQFRVPPFPPLEVYGVADRRRPVRAVDHRGRDVRDRVLARDRRYPDGFDRDYSGVAERHHLELDFGDLGGLERPMLVLHGWVDWADGSTFLALSQERPEGLPMPTLEARGPGGRWQTVIAEMGIPAGKPKTIAVDLTGKLPPGTRELRIVTELCVYWDEIYLGESVAPSPVVLREVPALAAELRFRGFSRPVIHPQRKQPESFVYADVRPTSSWNPTRGLYTRYGDVAPLLDRADDRFVIMGSGDEVRLLFDAAALPPVAPGERRELLLGVDGWAKDGDANTAHSQTVGPLPFRAMPAYPYDPPHAYPDDEEHRRYRELYNTRPALRLIRPLREGAERAADAGPADADDELGGDDE